MSLTRPPRTSSGRLGARRHGVASSESRDPIGYAVAFLNRLAGTSALDRIGLRKHTERAVFEATRTGFRTAGAVSRAFSRGTTPRGGPARVPDAQRPGVFDLTPSEDEQMLADVATELAAEVLRPAASAADQACAAPPEVLAAAAEVGLAGLAVPEQLGGISSERSAMAGTLVTEALAHGDMGLTVAMLAPGSVATALALWGDDEQQATYLPAFTGDDVPVAALALAEPHPLADPLQPRTTARRTGDGFVLDGVKSLVPRAAEAELFVVAADLEGRPALFLVESDQAGLGVEADPGMGLRAASMSRVLLDGVRVGPLGLLGDADGSAATECVRLSRLASCALAVGTGQAVLDYVIPYVNERQAFGEPISHRQSVAFLVANIGIELQAMRLVTYRAASRAAQGRSHAREVALARRLCAERGMQIGNDGVQLLGGHGFVKEHPVERWYRDLRAIGVMEGAVLV
ncbi:MAG TPA: acyl-CoA dehydrogenase family protein [Nocardioidaceae bacterium]|nr:acyl-CoA dehydrogenase family protein [Nocardioidaceae bacterium]